MEKPESNTYLGEVIEQQQRVDSELRVRSKSSFIQRAGPGAPPEAPGTTGRAIDYRITGWWRFKTVVVPPNVYVVHTRRGRPEAVTLGLGQSFAFNPYTDAFLLIPAAMQTILISARCICAERQGILVQGYVQWIIDDIGTAYRKLDFSDAEDPMRIVNVQLREQAEAAIKDKVSTLGVDDVLADKQPIIEELTTRLRAVAEGSREGSGLGLKIVTVQIKEAVVSSTTVWQNLQKPFRAERERLARMAEIEAARQIQSRELEISQARETAEMESRRAIEDLRARNARESYDREQAEAARRLGIEQEAARRASADRAATERAALDADLETDLFKLETTRRRWEAETNVAGVERALEAARQLGRRQEVEAELVLEETRSAARALTESREIDAARQRRALDNDVSAALLQSRLLEALPEVAARLPAPAEMKTLHIGGDTSTGMGQITALLAALRTLLQETRPSQET